MSELLAIEPVHIYSCKEKGSATLPAAVLCAACVVRTWLQLEHHVMRLVQGRENNPKEKPPRLFMILNLFPGHCDP